MRHLWYSSATDITGRKLAEALNAEGTREKPRNVADDDIVICWGTKTKKDVSFAHGTILNHPNAIRKNRNKYTALELMRADRDLAGNIATFCPAESVISKIQHGEMCIPLIGRTNFHQGGKGFWLCLSEFQIKSAIAEGAQYFQKFIDIKDEYRIHVFGNKVIYAVKKTENATEAGWISQRKEKITDYAQKNNININVDTLDYTLKVLYTEQQLPDRIVRSNHRGWKFASVKLNSVPTAMKNAAIKALNTIGMDFGAVDCCVDSNNHPYIIEINSGPGLQGTTFEKYVAELTKKIVDIERPADEVRPAQHPIAQRNRAVGADIAELAPANNEGGIAGVIGREQAQIMMRNVKNDAEARELLNLLVGG